MHLPIYEAFESYMDEMVIAGRTQAYLNLADYLPSGSRSHGETARGLGPVESQLLDFFDEVGGEGKLGYLKGEVGSGKTTTLRYVALHYLSDEAHSKKLELKPRFVVEIDFNIYMQMFVDPERIKTKSEVRSTSRSEFNELVDANASIATSFDFLVEHVSGQISRYWQQHLSPEHEFINMWDWALDPKTDLAQIPLTHLINRTDGPRTARG